MKSKILGLLAVGLLTVGPVNTAYASVVFDFTGTCEISCDRFGLANGMAFNEVGALRLRDGVNTAAGSNLLLSDFESFSLFGIDFLTGSTVLQLADPGVGFVGDDVLGGFRMLGGPNGFFCYNTPNTSCADGRFDTYIGSIAEGGFGHGPGVFTRQSVPEPGTLALLGLGLAGLGMSRNRFRRRDQ